MVVFENRRAVAVLAVSTGSAEGCRSQPGMGQINPGLEAELGADVYRLIVLLAIGQRPQPVIV
jgi:hypothetical protein